MPPSQTVSICFFFRFLLEPLLKQDKLRSQSPEGGSDDEVNKRVIVLLDAMDESDDSGKGWEPVALLVANE